MKKITLDFENETVELHFDGQNGVEHFPGLKELEQPILSLLGYQKVDMRPVADAVNAYVNGQISEQESTPPLPPIPLTFAAKYNVLYFAAKGAAPGRALSFQQSMEVAAMSYAVVHMQKINAGGDSRDSVAHKPGTRGTEKI